MVIAGLILLSLTTGCSSTLAVDSEWNREVDFEALKSYAWISQDKGPSREQQLPSHLDLRLRRVVDEILSDEKGFEKAPSPARADFLLAYYIDTRKGLKVNYSAYAGYYGGYGYGYWPGYYGPRGMGFATAGAMPTVREYTTGTLVLDIVDPETKTLIWTGVIQGEAKYRNPSGERVTKVMTQMLKKFPPPETQ